MQLFITENEIAGIISVISVSDKIYIYYKEEYTMKFKLCAVTLAVLMAATALAGCGNQENASVSNDGVYEIIWHDKGPLTPEHEMVYEEVNKYLEPYGMKVKNIPFASSEYTEKMRLILASQSKFDLCFTSSGNNYEINAANDAYMNIDELLKSHGKGILEQVPDYVIDAAKINNELYAVPCYKDYSQENVFYYRTDLAEKYNLPMDSVKTLDDLEPIWQTIKAKEPDIYTALFTASLSPYNMLPFEKVSGGVVGSIDLKGDTTKIINPFETEAAMEYFKTMHRYYEQGFFRPEVATLTSNDDVKGNEFMRIEQELPYLVDQRNQTSPHQYSVLHLQEKPLMTTSCVRGAMIAFAKNCANPEKAMEFLNLLNTDSHLRNLIAYGIEGKHYIAVGEDQYKLPEGCATKADTGYETYVFTQGNKYITRMIEGTPADIFDKYIEFDETSQKSPMLGFSFDPANVKSEFTAVSNAYNQYMPALLTGMADPEEVLPDAMKKLKDAGLDKLIAEMQKQYDEWLALTGRSN